MREKRGSGGIDREQRETQRAEEDRKHDREMEQKGDMGEGGREVGKERSKRGAVKLKADSHYSRCVID